MRNTVGNIPQRLSEAQGLRIRIAAAALVAVCASAAIHADDKLCANYSAQPPTIDGVIATDPGWQRSNMYVFNNGSDTPHARLQMTTDQSALYFALEINNDPTFDREDIIVLTLAPTPTNRSTDLRIHIFPVEGAGNNIAAPGGPPADVKYWTNSSSWNQMSLPTWLTRGNNGSCRNICVTSSPPKTGMKSYFVEIKVPISPNADQGVNLPNSNDFGLYFNIIRATTANPNTPQVKVGLEELRWPSTAPLISGNPSERITRIEQSTPTFNDWGQATLDGACSGIRVKRAYTNTPSGNSININSTNNIFSVELENTGSAPGTGVVAQVKSARFGLPGKADFELYPAPSTWRGVFGPSGVIPANGGTVILSTPPWDLVNDQNRQNYVTRTDACSFIELSTAPTTGTTPVTTLISNRIAYHNMHFGTASKFEHTAVLGTRGYERPSDGSNLQRFQLFTSTETDSEIFGEPQIFRDESRRRVFSSEMEKQFIENKTRFFRKTVCGYRHTGREVIVEGTTLKMLESANCFGYLIGHDGPFAGWAHKMVGGGGGSLEAVSGNSNVFVASVPDGKSMELRTTIEASERPSGSCKTMSLGGGSATLVAFVGIAVWVTRRKRPDRTKDGFERSDEQNS